MFSFYVAFLRHGEIKAHETKMQRIFCIRSLRAVIDRIKCDAAFQEAEKAVIYRLEEGHYNKAVTVYKEAIA